MLRLIDLLHLAVDDVRQGGDPRLPLELALVKVTRPGADLSRESTAYRLEQLETAPARRGAAAAAARGRAAETEASAAPPPPAEAARPTGRPRRAPGSLEAVDPAHGLGEVDPDRLRPRRGAAGALEGDRLVLEFPPAASFHRGLAEDPKNASVLAAVPPRGDRTPAHPRVRARRRALGRGSAEAEDEPATEEEIIALVQTTFDTRKLGKDGE